MIWELWLSNCLLWNIAYPRRAFGVKLSALITVLPDELIDMLELDFK